jgi:hypothetical protein
LSKNVSERAGIRNFHFPDPRPASFSYVVMRGALLKSVQEHLGNLPLVGTQKYAHLSAEFQRAEMEKLSGLFPGELASRKKKVISEDGPGFPDEDRVCANARWF